MTYGFYGLCGDYVEGIQHDGCVRFDCPRKCMGIQVDEDDNMAGLCASLCGSCEDGGKHYA
ncbi:MAG TPA: hypothetical protein IAA54_05520 [Candidatus Gallacutalibacter pullicola]|uniref:Uncharacterized protein n=1 Tax=Candidatus Gallacutalibacter pullicola TaxID=2840830 RepID=A0A9D1DQN2_9FIRM|nr:hypothetical protein [Candidatus Gallacutalibacter pullicola]